MALAAARLQRGVPNLWSDFVQVFDALRDDAVTACVQVDGDQLRVWQGRARQLKELSDALHDCVPTAEKIEAKMKERK